MAIRRWGGTLVMVAVFAAPAVAGGKPKAAIMDLQADAKLEPGIVSTLNQVLLSSFHETGKYEVIGSSDITAMLSLEEERIKLTGCADESCLAEIGGALGVQLMVTSRVGAVGDQYVVSLNLLDVRKAKVVGRTSQMVQRDDSKLIAALTDAVNKVTSGHVMEALPDRTTTGDTSAGVAAAPAGQPGVPAEQDELTVMDWVPWLTLGLTVAVGAVGGVMGGLAWSDAGDARDRMKGDPEAADLEDGAETKALVADVMFGVAGAAAVATVLLFVLGRDKDQPAATATVMPLRDGAAAGVTLRFR